MKYLFIILLLCQVLSSKEILEEGSKKPNVVLFFIDDLGWNDLACYGSKFYDTPHIDLLAEKGVKFNTSYSAHPVCSPTRAALLTGKAPQRVGITDWIHQPSEIHLPLKEITLAEALQEGGYTTAYFGKWHLGEKDKHMPNYQGFDYTYGVNRAGQPGSYFFPYKRKEKNGNSYRDVPDFEDGKKGDYLTDELTDKVVDYIIKISQGDKPFFLQLSHYAVHSPIESPEELTEKYKKKRKKLYGDTPTKTLKLKLNSSAHVRGRQDNVKYAAMIKNLDNNIGKVTKILDKLGIADNTIIIFTSDNGGYSTGKWNSPTSTLPLRAGKGWNYEGGIRIPTLITWGNKLAKKEVDVPIITMDMYPTILDLVGLPLKVNQHLDGKSLKKVLFNENDKSLKNRFLAWTYPHNHGSGHTPSHAIREGNWKLIHFEQEGYFELYNLKEDEGELNNLVSQKKDLVKNLKVKLARWLAETTVK